MASEPQPNPTDSWNQVASELRAYREAQQQAWGEVDNATLGRFIADDLNRDERRQIEQALQEHPELQKLTDLVRDVLADFEPAAERTPAPPIPVPAPRILPFPKKQPARSSVVGWVKQRSGMLAAACLLVALSGGLLDPRVSSALFGDRAAPNAAPDRSTTVAMAPNGYQSNYPGGNKVGDAGPNPLAFASGAAGLNRLKILNHKIDNLEQAGKLQEALALDEKAETVARRANLEQHLTYAANRELVAGISEKQGDLDRATVCLNQAYAIKRKELGPENKETAKTAQTLANLYATAINSENNSMVAFAPMAAPAGHPNVMAVRTGQATERKDPEHKNVQELRVRLLHEGDTFLQQQVVPVMVQGLENAATGKEREQFIQALGNLGPKAAVARSALKERLHLALAAEGLHKDVRPVAADDNGVTDRERCTLLWALGRMGPEARDVVPVLIEALNSNSFLVRNTAASALVQMGPEVREPLSLYVKSEAKDNAKAVASAQDVLKRLDEPRPLGKQAAKAFRTPLGLAVGPAAGCIGD